MAGQGKSRHRIFFVFRGENIIYLLGKLTATNSVKSEFIIFFSSKKLSAFCSGNKTPKIGSYPEKSSRINLGKTITQYPEALFINDIDSSPF
ncbi:MAG: hypothetical protein A4E71_02990 [Smithella sp. PtaU1.Bin162]|nr:MAG: hypothetical protein A4E71_02990 [Smithella sp. PtaU1.Bin162]